MQVSKVVSRYTIITLMASMVFASSALAVPELEVSVGTNDTAGTAQALGALGAGGLEVDDFLGGIHPTTDDGDIDFYSFTATAGTVLEYRH